MVRTSTMLAVLRRMAEAEAAGLHEDAEIVCSGLDCWIGLARTNHAVVRALLLHVVVSDVSDEAGMRRYALNGTGKAAVRRPEILPEIVAALAAGTAFTVRDDRIIPVDNPG